ncbi:uncharacterized protein NEMAJ01_1959 [Nematocida major]|uniref:uncharacterized protein n=1 Tax=Nematocida major TaxID=1912982 RepID=UPI0020074581|nr:uncharacterized protein NEMAJ01_1959 [Nematocida major]KAH9387063.1 hypothetical protein NEMAJ01_1959 [Nematocida major]
MHTISIPSFGRFSCSFWTEHLYSPFIRISLVSDTSTTDMLAEYSRKEKLWLINNIAVSSSDNLMLSLAGVQYFLTLAVPPQEPFYEIDEIARAIRRGLKAESSREQRSRVFTTTHNAGQAQRVYSVEGLLKNNTPQREGPAGVRFSQIYSHFKRKLGVSAHRQSHYQALLESSSAFLKTRSRDMVGNTTTLWHINSAQYAFSRKARSAVQCIEVRSIDGKVSVSVSYTSLKLEKARRALLHKTDVQEALHRSLSPENTSSSISDLEMQQECAVSASTKEDIQGARKKVTEYLKEKNPHIRPALERMFSEDALPKPPFSSSKDTQPHAAEQSSKKKTDACTGRYAKRHARILKKQEKQAAEESAAIDGILGKRPEEAQQEKGSSPQSRPANAKQLHAQASVRPRTKSSFFIGKDMVPELVDQVVKLMPKKKDLHEKTGSCTAQEKGPATDAEQKTPKSPAERKSLSKWLSGTFLTESE